MKRSQLLQVWRIRDCGAFCFKEDIYITIPPHGSGSSWETGRLQEAELVGDCSETASSRLYRGCACMHKIKPAKTSVWIGVGRLRNSTLSWGAIEDQQQVLEGWELVFFRWNDWEPIQWVHSTHAHTSSTMGIQGIERGECEVRRGERLESRGRMAVDLPKTCYSYMKFSNNIWESTLVCKDRTWNVYKIKKEKP